MKNRFIYIFTLILGLTVLSCREQETGKLYEDEQLLQFYEKTSSSVAILAGTGNQEVVIKFGTLKPVTSTQTVTLVADPTSTAIEGVNYVVVKGTDELTSGEVNGEFIVRILEAGSTPALKTAKFKLSSSIANAVYNDLYTLTMSKTCPTSYFLGTGDFDNTGWWLGSGTVTVEQGAAANALVIKNYFEPGYDFTITYDSANKVTFTDQDTGYFHPTYGANIRARVKQTATSAESTIDKCTRTVNVTVNFYIPGVGSFGDKVETFTGL